MAPAGSFSNTSTPDAEDLSGFQRIVEVSLIDDASPRAVDQDHAVFHQGDLFARDHVPCLGGEGGVEGNHVRFPQDVVEVVVKDGAHRIGFALLDIRVVGDHPHAEALRPYGDVGAYPPEPDHAEGLMVKLHPHEPLPVPFTRLEGIMGKGYLPGCRKHNAHGQLCCGKGIAGRRVHHDDALFACRFYIDVIEAHPCPADYLQLTGTGQQRCGDGRAAPGDYGVVVAYDSGQLVASDPRPDDRPLCSRP